MREIGVQFPVGSDQSLKQVATAPLLNVRQQVLMPQVLGDDDYKGPTRVIHVVGVAR